MFIGNFGCLLFLLISVEHMYTYISLYYQRVEDTLLRQTDGQTDNERIIYLFFKNKFHFANVSTAEQ